MTPHKYELDTALSLYHLPSGQMVEYPYLTAWVHDHLRLPLIAARWVFAGYLLLVCIFAVRVRRNRSRPRTTTELRAARPGRASCRAVPLNRHVALTQLRRSATGRLVLTGIVGGSGRTPLTGHYRTWPSTPP